MVLHAEHDGLRPIGMAACSVQFLCKVLLGMSCAIWPGKVKLSNVIKDYPKDFCLHYFVKT